MTDILDEASAVVQCQECSWYRSCVMPLRFTPEDIRRQMEAAPGGLGPQTQEMQYLVANMAAAAQSILLEACPIFMQRLQANPQLAQRLKEMMRTWGME
ncbi:MAG: hypothetical protein Q8P59_07930 [Dehalococcoidia bacterium]|nr:hypothetical protein [Dehalococcoidia bacterium]